MECIDGDDDINEKFEEKIGNLISAMKENLDNGDLMTLTSNIAGFRSNLMSYMDKNGENDDEVLKIFDIFEKEQMIQFFVEVLYTKDIPDAFLDSVIVLNEIYSQSVDHSVYFCSSVNNDLIDYLFEVMYNPSIILNNESSVFSVSEISLNNLFGVKASDLESSDSILVRRHLSFLFRSFIAFKNEFALYIEEKSYIDSIMILTSEFVDSFLELVDSYICLCFINLKFLPDKWNIIRYFDYFKSYYKIGNNILPSSLYGLTLCIEKDILLANEIVKSGFINEIMILFHWKREEIFHAMYSLLYMIFIKVDNVFKDSLFDSIDWKKWYSYGSIEAKEHLIESYNEKVFEIMNYSPRMADIMYKNGAFEPLLESLKEGNYSSKTHSIKKLMIIVQQLSFFNMYEIVVRRDLYEHMKLFIIEIQPDVTDQVFKTLKIILESVMDPQTTFDLIELFFDEQTTPNIEISGLLDDTSIALNADYLLKTRDDILSSGLIDV